MLLSGTRATFVPRKDTLVSKEAISAALKKKGMEFVSLTKEERPKAHSGYVLEVTGLG